MTTEGTADLTLPADSAYVAVLRMTTAGLGARLDLTLDDIEDLRMAVSEASALILEVAREGGLLRASYALDEGRIRVTVSTDNDQGELDRESFGWQVLSALTTELDAVSDGATRSISFTVTSSADVNA
ncbi:MAG TPA: ATP-binding protein [Marmoricola sp.]